MNTTASLATPHRHFPVRAVAAAAAILVTGLTALAIAEADDSDAPAKPATATASTPALDPNTDPLVNRYGQPERSLNDDMITRFGTP